MNFQNSTIKDCIERISNDEYVIPAIQREFVWDTEQIESLFDSLMQGFPISSFLFWEVDRDNVNKFKFYKFIKNYHRKNNRYNESYDNINKDKIVAILDGQQRLTSLYIALKGDYAVKRPYKDEYPKKELYLNILSGKKSEDYKEQVYEFKFLTNDEVEKSDMAFFRVKDIFGLEKSSQAIKLANKYLNKVSDEDFEIAQDNLANLWHLIHEEKVINYHLETSKELDKVLQIFVRVNSGGTKLSHSDLLMSIATADWKNKDARQEIQDLVKEVSDDFGFKISKDFVLKCCLMLCDLEVAFKVNNFNKNNMETIEKNWDKIKNSIIILFSNLQNIGLDEDKISSYNSLVPVIYYIYKNGNKKLTQKDRELIYKWIVITAIKQTFSGHSDTMLNIVRSAIYENKDLKIFPLSEIEEKINYENKNKSISFKTEEDFEFILDFQYGKSVTYLVLNFLYSGKVPNTVYHQDHIFAKNNFTNVKLDKLGLSDNEIKIYKQKLNSIANIQLLQGNNNISKSDSDFQEWLIKNYPDKQSRLNFLNGQLMPVNADFDIKNFLKFIEDREQLILKKLKELLLN